LLTVRVGKKAHGETYTRQKYNLYGYQVTSADESHFIFQPTRDEFKQRIGFALFICVFAGVPLAFVQWAISTGEDPARDTTILIWILAIGGGIAFFAMLPVLTWFRSRLEVKVDPDRNLTITSRTWRTRRATHPLGQLTEIHYGPRRAGISSVPVQEIPESRIISKYWTWHITLTFRHDGANATSYQVHFDLVSQNAAEIAESDLAPPEKVLALGRWLKNITQLPITHLPVPPE
jgi:hypothetical protein